MSEYAKAKGLDIPEAFQTVSVELKRRISDFRDYQIAHEKSPRTIRGSILDAKGTRIMMIRVPQSQTDQWVELESIGDLKDLIEVYIDRVIGFMELNAESAAMNKLRDRGLSDGRAAPEIAVFTASRRGR